MKAYLYLTKRKKNTKVVCGLVRRIIRIEEEI